MSLPEFLEKLRETPRDWGFDAEGRIRTKFGASHTCPWLAIDGTIPHNQTPCVLRPLNWQIAAAADKHDYLQFDEEAKFDPELRAQLLAACGLEEAQ